MTTFVAAVPANAPRYVFVVSLDEASVFAAGMVRRTAGWTAAPVTGETIRRIAPILGLRPVPDAAPDPGIAPIPVNN
jgi:cell division protein FtsI (penicillin-binding protein 3)